MRLLGKALIALANGRRSPHYWGARAIRRAEGRGKHSGAERCRARSKARRSQFGNAALSVDQRVRQIRRNKRQVPPGRQRWRPDQRCPLIDNVNKKKYLVVRDTN